jgi:hypothetical protein
MKRKVYNVRQLHDNHKMNNGFLKIRKNGSQERSGGYLKKRWED